MDLRSKVTTGGTTGIRFCFPMYLKGGHAILTFFIRMSLLCMYMPAMVLMYGVVLSPMVTLAIDSVKAVFKSLYPGESDLSIELKKMETASEVIEVMNGDSLDRVITGILLTPSGVLSMSPFIEGLVQTSNNLGIVTTGDTEVVLTNYMRSSMTGEQEMIINRMLLLAEAIGAEYKINRLFPAWVYNEDSDLREQLTEVYRNVYGREPIITMLHAGLECAIFTPKISDCDFISIGPDIRDAHSPDERLSIPSYNRMCELIIKALEEL